MIERLKKFLEKKYSTKNLYLITFHRIEDVKYNGISMTTFYHYNHYPFQVRLAYSRHGNQDSSDAKYIDMFTRTRYRNGDAPGEFLIKKYFPVEFLIEKYFPVETSKRKITKKEAEEILEKARKALIK